MTDGELRLEDGGPAPGGNGALGDGRPAPDDGARLGNDGLAPGANGAWLGDSGLAPGANGARLARGRLGFGDGEPALRGSDLCLSYRKRAAVTGAEIELWPGKVTALIGPNGSGKSTLLRALARLHRPDTGRVTVGEDDAQHLSAKAFARQVTLLAQSRPTPSGVTVADVVGYGRHPYQKRWRASDPDGVRAVAHAMRLTGVEAMADRPVDELSGGELQRVWLATCLAQDTGVLLLDEPTTFLDLRYQVEVLDLVRDLAEQHGVAVGVVLHDLNQAAAIADHLVLLAGGRVHASGRPEEVLTTQHLSHVYGLRIEVVADPITSRLSCRPIGRHSLIPVQ